MKLHRIFGLMAAAAFLAAGCANGNAPSPNPAAGGGGGDTGTIYAALTLPGPVHDVASMEFKVVAGTDDCSGTALLPVKNVPLHPEMLPTGMDPNGASGDSHPFADALFVLPPGTYRVCAQPLTDKLEVSQYCAPTTDLFTVLASATTEKVLISQCAGTPNGAIDIPAELNDPPTVDLLQIAPSKFITTCQVGELHATASDPNGDPIDFTWSVVSKPDLAQVWLDGSGANYWFKACLPGDYQLKVTACDPHGACTSLTFPMHVLKVGTPFTVTQDGNSFQIGTLEGTTDVASFYSYGSPNASSANTGLEIEDKALVFIYRDTTTNIYSLVMIFDVPHDQEGGQVQVQISGLDPAATLAVKDDPGDSYNLATGVMSWNWQPCCTDGLAITVPDKYLCITITPQKIIVPSNNQPPNAYDWNFAWTDENGQIQYRSLPNRRDPIHICHCLGGQPFPPVVR